MRAGTSQVVGTKVVGTMLEAGNPWVQNRGVASCLQGSHAAVGTVEVSTALLAVEVAVRQGAEAEEVNSGTVADNSQEVLEDWVDVLA